MRKTICLTIGSLITDCRGVRFGHIVCQIGPNSDKFGTFAHNFSVQSDSGLYPIYFRSFADHNLLNSEEQIQYGCYEKL